MHEPQDATPAAPVARGRLRWGRRRGGRASAGGPSRFERVLFSFMGPPQLGDVNAPVRELPAVPAALCPKCGQPYDEHEVVRDPRLTYTRCPRPLQPDARGAGPIAGDGPTAGRGPASQDG